MPQQPIIYSLEHDSYWVDVLRALESGETTREHVCVLNGFGERTLQRRLARARVVREDFEVFDPGEGDEYDYPHLAITSDPSRERGHWIEPESGHASVETGRVRVGNYSGTRMRIRKINGGRQGDDSGPTKYDPDPELKGGVG